MQIDDIPLMSMLKDRMSWLSKRQDVLSQNVANADVPGYMPKDLKPQDFDSTLRSTMSQSQSVTSLTVTDPRHIPASATMTSSSSRGFAVKDSPDVAAPPGGNSVSLESEMIKVAETQAQYQAAANLYAKAITMMKVAIGRGGA
jgi:flagellar basal-body rod protein FlgB